ARSEGIDVAYAPITESPRREELINLVVAWMETSTWDDSRTFLTEHAPELLSDDAEGILSVLVEENPDVYDLLAHLGLLGLVRSDGIDAAYAFIEDLGGLPAAEIVVDDREPRSL